MNHDLTQNTKAILLLTAPLIVGGKPGASELLSPGEYNRLVRLLVEAKHQPRDLLGADAAEVLRHCEPVLEKGRATRLLARGFLLSQAVEHWRSRAIWVVSRADEAYPAKLKVRLRDAAPALLYGCGDSSILGTGGLAVVGSRHVNAPLIKFAESIGQLAAHAQKTLVSGGAKGIDQAAMRGAIEAGGRVVGVVADSLERTALNRANRDLLLEEQMVLVSPYDPNAGFNVGNAMQRNKVIYAFADAALVVSADLNKGGTWAGAVEQLDKLQLVPVYVRVPGGPDLGLDALRKKGARTWPNPVDTDGLVEALRAPAARNVPSQGEFAFGADGAVAPPKAAGETARPSAKVSAGGARQPKPTRNEPARESYDSVRDAICELLVEPMSADQIATTLGLQKAQVGAWLTRLVKEGVLEKHKRPVRYTVRAGDLFDQLGKDTGESRVAED